MALKKEMDFSSNTMFPPFKKTRFSDQIADLIQGKILKDRLETGTRLPSEKEIAEEFKVSRSVIREALRILEISGLVSVKKGPTGGIFVSNIYQKPIINSFNNMISSGEVTIDHLFDVRFLIEPHIAYEAALHASRSDLKKLKELIAYSTKHAEQRALRRQGRIQRGNYGLGSSASVEPSGNRHDGTLGFGPARVIRETCEQFDDGFLILRPGQIRERSESRLANFWILVRAGRQQLIDRL